MKNAIKCDKMRDRRAERFQIKFPIKSHRYRLHYQKKFSQKFALIKNYYAIYGRYIGNFIYKLVLRIFFRKKFFEANSIPKSAF